MERNDHDEDNKRRERQNEQTSGGEEAMREA